MSEWVGGGGRSVLVWEPTGRGTRVFFSFSHGVCVTVVICTSPSSHTNTTTTVSAPVPIGFACSQAVREFGDAVAPLSSAGPPRPASGRRKKRSGELIRLKTRDSRSLPAVVDSRIYVVVNGPFLCGRHVDSHVISYLSTVTLKTDVEHSSHVQVPFKTS